MNGPNDSDSSTRDVRRMTGGDRLRQIIDEATRIIGQSGHYGFSVQQVADACGLTKAGLLHHVKSKDELLMLVLKARDQADMDLLSTLGDATRAFDDGDPDVPLTTVLDGLHVLVEHNSHQPQIVRLYAVLRNESLDEHHPCHDYFIERDATALKKFENAFASRVEDPSSFARQLLALMGGLEEQWLRNPSIDLVEEWDEAVAVLVRGAQRAKA